MFPLDLPFPSPFGQWFPVWSPFCHPVCSLWQRQGLQEGSYGVWGGGPPSRWVFQSPHPKEGFTRGSPPGPFCYLLGLTSSSRGLLRYTERLLKRWSSGIGVPGFKSQFGAQELGVLWCALNLSEPLLTCNGTPQLPAGRSDVSPNVGPERTVGAP